MKLGLNIDHISTLRQARGASVPDPVEAAAAALSLGVDYIVVHLRQDRRHVQEYDLEKLCNMFKNKVHLEMAAVKEMAEIAEKHKPYSVCIVPEYPNELTTSGGLKLDDALTQTLKPHIAKLKENKMKVSLFIDPNAQDVRAAKRLGADIVELCTKDYSEAKTKEERRARLEELSIASILGAELGLEVHSGHGLNYDNVSEIAQIAAIECLNIGFSIIARAVLAGLPQAVMDMRKKIDLQR
jgi:pyridoxine 5-phosphate synthase